MFEIVSFEGSSTGQVFKKKKRKRKKGLCICLILRSLVSRLIPYFPFGGVKIICFQLQFKMDHKTTVLDRSCKWIVIIPNKRGTNMEATFLKVKAHVKVKFLNLGPPISISKPMFLNVSPPHESFKSRILRIKGNT